MARRVGENSVECNAILIEVKYGSRSLTDQLVALIRGIHNVQGFSFFGGTLKLAAVNLANSIVLSFVGSLVLGGLVAITGGILRGQSWYAYAWATVLSIPVAWLLKVFGILLTPVSSGESGGWQGFAKMFVLIALFPPLPVLFALIVQRPKKWQQGAIAAGVILLCGLLIGAHYFETRPVQLKVRDVSGKPMAGWMVKASVSTPYGRPAVSEVTTDSNGNASLRIRKGTFVGFEIHRPFGSGNPPAPLEEAQWIDLSIAETNDKPGTEISARWQTSYGAGQVNTYTYESVSAQLDVRPGELVIPVMTRKMDQPLNLGYHDVWSTVWPEAKIEDRTLRRLVSVPEEMRRISATSGKTRDACGELREIATQLRKLQEILHAIDYLPQKNVEQTPQNKRFFDQVATQGRLLCEYLNGDPLNDPEERLTALRHFLEIRADQLMTAVEPWMQQGREAYSILDEMGKLARPASKKYATIYPRADRDTQEAILRTFFPLGPAPEDILFALDEASDKSLYAFSSAMRCRPKEDINRDWAVFQDWQKSAPGNLTDQQVERIRDSFQERANR